MDNISIEQKLELVKQIRSKYNKNISDMSQRERVLYGRTSYSSKEEVKGASMVDRSWYYEEPAEEATVEDFSFGRVRFFIAVILLIGVIILDLSGKTLMGVSMDKIFAVISQDYEEEIAAWVSQATVKVTEVDGASQEMTDMDTVDVDSVKKE